MSAGRPKRRAAIVCALVASVWRRAPAAAPTAAPTATSPVSADNAASHKAFAAHHKLPFHLVSDERGALAKACGVPNNGGFLARQSIAIGAYGNAKKIYRDVDVTKHASQILADVGS